MTYGSDVFAMTFGDPEGRSDPMNVVFPKVMMVMMVMMVVMVVMVILMVMVMEKTLPCRWQRFHDGQHRETRHSRQK